jgi:hypothetical protein
MLSPFRLRRFRARRASQNLLCKNYSYIPSLRHTPRPKPSQPKRYCENDDCSDTTGQGIHSRSFVQLASPDQKHTDLKAFIQRFQQDGYHIVLMGGSNREHQCFPARNFHWWPHKRIRTPVCNPSYRLTFLAPAFSVVSFGNLTPRSYTTLHQPLDMYDSLKRLSSRPPNDFSEFLPCTSVRSR